MDDIYKNSAKYNANKNSKISNVFHDMFNKKTLNPVVTELFIRGRKLNISLVFIT